MTPDEVVADLQQRLAAAGVEEARLEAEVLVMHVLGVDRARLYTHGEEHIVSRRDRQRLEALLARRLQREPLAYIVGRREFYDLDFLVDRRALIPRPETETLVEHALHLARSISPDGAITVADAGAGCGAIAVALACHLPRAVVWATDTSRDALDLAAENARRHGVADRIRFLAGDLLEPLPRPVDLIASNPPYVPSERLPTLALEIRHEPREALDGGPSGTHVLLRLVHQAPARLNPGGAFLTELDPEQVDLIAREARGCFPNARIEVIPDLAGLARVIAASLPKPEVPKASA